jgi:hypothetical protein
MCRRQSRPRDQQSLRHAKGVKGMENRPKPVRMLTRFVSPFTTKRH